MNILRPTLHAICISFFQNLLIFLSSVGIYGAQKRSFSLLLGLVSGLDDSEGHSGCGYLEDVEDFSSVIGGGEMVKGDTAHVEVIADAGSVGGWVIGSVDNRWFGKPQLVESNLEQQHH